VQFLASFPDIVQKLRRTIHSRDKEKSAVAKNERWLAEPVESDYGAGAQYLRVHDRLVRA
jgi:hypothetical protein